jgi:hypothetical protein
MHTGDVDVQRTSGHLQGSAGRDHQRTPTYEGIPGLIRKYYGIAPDGSSLVGIYLWESQAAANAFYTADWVAMVTKRWAVPPQRQEWETPHGCRERRAAPRCRRIVATVGRQTPP